MPTGSAALALWLALLIDVLGSGTAAVLLPYRRCLLPTYNIDGQGPVGLACGNRRSVRSRTWAWMAQCLAIVPLVVLPTPVMPVALL